MKATHVQARIDKRGITRCQLSCCGWLVRMSPHPRLMACTACNALHPARLQITDAMVKILPQAREGLAAATRTFARERMERATTRHAPTVSGTLCGHSIGRTKSGRRTHVLSFVAERVTCAECQRLAAMTPAERDAERRERSAELATKFKAKRDEAAAAREQQHMDTEKRIAAARVDARVALDILETVNFDYAKLAQMTLDEQPAIASSASERIALVAETIAMAVTAYRHIHRASRGERRWVFRNEGSESAPARRSGPRRGTSDVRCRFCDTVLLVGGVIGEDYTAITDTHTVRCALEYLAGKLPVTLVDAENIDECNDPDQKKDHA